MFLNHVWLLGFSASWAHRRPHSAEQQQKFHDWPLTITVGIPDPFPQRSEMDTAIQQKRSNIFTHFFILYILRFEKKEFFFGCLWLCELKVKSIDATMKGNELKLQPNPPYFWRGRRAHLRLPQKMRALNSIWKPLCCSSTPYIQFLRCLRRGRKQSLGTFTVPPVELGFLWTFAPRPPCNAGWSPFSLASIVPPIIFHAHQGQCHTWYPWASGRVARLRQQHVFEISGIVAPPQGGEFG